jgi:hypothetical protein
MKKLAIAALAVFSLSVFAAASTPAPAKVEAKKAEKPASAKK